MGLIMSRKSTANVSDLHTNIMEGGNSPSRNARNVKILSLNRQVDIWTSLFVHELNVCKSMSSCICSRLHIFKLSVVLINSSAGNTI